MENNQTKKCINKDCGKTKLIIEFSINRARPDGRNDVCKSCKIIIFDKYRRTKEGLVTKIYGTQKASSIRRCHHMPSYTRKELEVWIFSLPLFHKLYDEWVDSGYKKMLVPSVDRKDDDMGYTMGNIQLMTWQENKDKAFADMRSGKMIVSSNPQIAVHKYSLDGVYIESYCSSSEAGRSIGVNHGHISAACLGNRKTAYGFKWKH